MRPIALAVLCVTAVPALAAELQPPRLLDTPGLVQTPIAGPGCPPVPALGPRRPARLVIRQAARPDVGPYTVVLPGYGTNPAPGTDDLYRPFLIEAQAGNTLRFDIVNQLAGSGMAGSGMDASGMDGVVNLHTHGLIVSPRRCAPFGDSVFVEDQPGTTTRYAITIPKTLPGALFNGGGQAQPYPDGLNWFHAHVHGKARLDVMAGQAGMLQVGDLRRTLLATPGLSPAAADLLNKTDVHYLGLRDIQLAVPTGKTPDQATPGQTAEWLRAGDYDPTACAGQANPPPATPGTSTSGPGFCTHPNASKAGAALPNQDTVWLFTVNGQWNPSVTQKQGRSQLWRVANLSANVSYLLQLADDATGTPQEMTVLSLDGLVAGTHAAADPALQLGVGLKTVLLMPASRAEIFVPAGSITQPMTLRTAGITTGPQGDPWPRIDLMHVLPAPQPAAAVALNVSLNRTTVELRHLFRLHPPRPEIIPAHCVTLPPGQSVRRRVTFANDANGAFVLGSEVVREDGTPVDTAHSVGPEVFPHAAMTSPGSLPHVCPRLGETEVWELVNTTGELHNFHIHQTKFRMAAPFDRGVPQGPLDMVDPTGIIAQFVPEAAGATPNARVDVWHDTLPVPPAGPAGPGRVFVTIPFLAPQQVGFFVYHCHILEHEDGGMMAVVQVFDPAAPQIASAPAPSDVDRLALASMCALPP